MHIDKTLLLGINVGGTQCSLVIGNGEGTIISHQTWPSEAEKGPDFMIQAILNGSKQLLTTKRAVKIGVAIGGPLNSRAGVIYSPPNLPGWDAIPLKSLLEQELSLPVNVEHDAAACAYAEYLWGAGREAENLAYLTCGTGFGAGFIFSGKIHRGARGGSCEVGHIGLKEEGPVAYGKKGSAESFASGTGLSLIAAWRFPERWRQLPPPGQELSTLAGKGDQDAITVLRINAEAVGEVAAILADTLGLDRVLIGSLARYLGEPWLEEVRRSFKQRVLPFIQETCEIKSCRLHENLQNCSTLAAALASD